MLLHWNHASSSDPVRSGGKVHSQLFTLWRHHGEEKKKKGCLHEKCSISELQIWYPRNFQKVRLGPSQRRWKRLRRLRCGQQKVASESEREKTKQNKNRTQGCWEGVVLCITSVKTHSPESPWDIIIFLPSLSWTKFGCAFVRWSETKGFSVFISHVFYWLHVCAGIQLWRRCSLVKGLILSAACRRGKRTRTGSETQPLMAPLNSLLCIWEEKCFSLKNWTVAFSLGVYLCQTLCPFVRMLLIQDVGKAT